MAKTANERRSEVSELYGREEEMEKKKLFS